MADFTPGDRVYVTDPALAELRQIMRSAGRTPKANHIGTVESVEDRAEPRVVIIFDSEDGEAQGGCAPYPLDEVRHMPEPGDPVYAPWPWEQG